MHRCSAKSLRMTILAYDEVVEELNGSTNVIESGDQLEGLDQPNQLLDLPIYSIGRIVQPRTMKLMGKIREAPTIVMIDSGASHGFVSRRLVEELGIRVEETSQFEVCLGDGHHTTSQGLCKGSKVNLAEIAIVVDASLRARGVDLILGGFKLGNVRRSAGRLGKYANAHRKDISFSTGDWVYLKLHLHRQQYVLQRVNAKFDTRYYGPFQILQKVGMVAYKLQLPQGSGIHFIFNASQLKKAMGANLKQSHLPAVLSLWNRNLSSHIAQ